MHKNDIDHSCHATATSLRVDRIGSHRRTRPNMVRREYIYEKTLLYKTPMSQDLLGILLLKRSSPSIREN